MELCNYENEEAYDNPIISQSHNSIIPQSHNLQVSKTPSSESNQTSVPLHRCVKNNPLSALREAHDVLRAKLLPQIYSLGFLNPDVEYFN